jgi:RNA polymerase sigma factor (sigma-70 family)
LAATIAAVSATPQELANLLSRTALGERAAFAQLYDKTASHLLGVVLRITRNRETAEDILQEVYVNVWNKAGSFNASLSQPNTWLTSIARNRAIDSLRRAQSSPKMLSTTVHGADEDDEHDMLQDFISELPGPAEQLEQTRDTQALRGCMGALSRDQQQVLALAFYQGASYAEAADHLQQPLGTVKSWVRRGLQALKGCLEAGGVGRLVAGGPPGGQKEGA